MSPGVVRSALKDLRISGQSPPPAAAAKPAAAPVDPAVAARAAADKKAAAAAKEAQERALKAENRRKRQEADEALMEKQVHLIDGPSSVYKSEKRFNELGLREELLKGIIKLGWVSPSEIQARTLETCLSGASPHLMAHAPTGSGKTGAFGLILLNRVDTRRGLQSLCLAPTRELALQTSSWLLKLGHFMTGLRVHEAVTQSDTSSRGAHIVVGTPGSVLGMLQRDRVNTREVAVFVIDEADSMLATTQRGGGRGKGGSMGEQVSNIRRQLPADMQVLLFSATFPPRMDADCQRMCGTTRTIKRLTVSSEGDAQRGDGRAEELGKISHFTIPCPTVGADPKFETLSNLYNMISISQSIIFCNSIRCAEELTRKMMDAGNTVSKLSGKMTPHDRNQVMDDFRHQRTRVLIATNVMARGTDVPDVSIVVNYEIPHGHDMVEAYHHRVGRCARFGRKGAALNLISDSRAGEDLRKIEQHWKLLPITLDLGPTGFENLESSTQMINSVITAST